LRLKGDIEGSKRLFAEAARVQKAKESELGTMLERK